MSTIFNRLSPLPKKPVQKHPWEGRVKDVYAAHMKYAHNSISSNPRYPKNPKKKPVEKKAKNKFTVIGSRFTKEFIYCKHIVETLYKYRSKVYDEPLVQGVTTVQWPNIYKKLKLKYGPLAFKTDSSVLVTLNDRLLGDYSEFKKYIENEYHYACNLDYTKEVVDELASIANSKNRPLVYMNFSIDHEHVGTMIFILYTDIVPETCANFIRLCCESRGGYGGTLVHRIVKDGWIQCGGFGLKSTDLKCENFIVDFDQRGILAMANAEKHVDCSTQFFIISQPAMWMKHNYVAFGQLVEGESTFKQIEEVPTWYESPTKNIQIENAGLLNLDCHYIKINKTTQAYLNGHIEDIKDIEKMCITMLMENVFDEILRRYLNKIEERAGEEVTPGEANEGMFNEDADENNDFDMESYATEEYHYQQVSEPLEKESTDIEPEVPYYLPFTDVPYPGEVESHFDLKRYIKGDYCLEKDLKQDQGRGKYKTLNSSIVSHLPDIDIGSSSTSSISSVDMDDEMQVYKVVRKFGEQRCFGGPSVRTISKSLCRREIMEVDKLNCALSDNELRKLRQARAEFAPWKKIRVSMLVSPGHKNKRVRRRPTGFIHGEDLDNMIQKLESSDESETSYDKDDGGIFVKEGGVVKIKTSTAWNNKHQRHSLKQKSLEDVVRRSTIQRLWEDVNLSNDHDPPTLKDFKTEGGLPQISTNRNFLTVSQKVETIESAESINRGRSPYNPLVREQQSVKAMTRESDIHLERSTTSHFRQEASISSREFKKLRPAITVTDYKKKNQSLPSIQSTGNRLQFGSRHY